MLLNKVVLNIFGGLSHEEQDITYFINLVVVFQVLSEDRPFMTPWNENARATIDSAPPWDTF